MYTILGISAGFPFIYIFFASEFQKQQMNQNLEFFPLALGGAIYMLGAIIYALRIPEKWYPKKFDLIGSSHNIHHVCVIIGCVIHFNSSMNLYLSRKMMVCPIVLPN